MTASVAIAAVALIVSILSLVISKLSYDRAGRIHDQQQVNAALQAKVALLALMSDCAATLNATRVDIGALKAYYDAEPESVKSLLVNFVGLFTEYLPSIEHALAVVETDRRAVASWGGGIPIADLEREKARMYNDLKAFQFADKQAQSLLRTFKEKLDLARAARSS